MINNKILLRTSLLFLSLVGLNNATSYSVNDSKLVGAYVKEMSVYLNEKGYNWDLSFVAQTIYAYYRSISSVGNPYLAKIEGWETFQKFKFTSLPSSKSCAIITNQKGNKTLKKWCITQDSSYLDGEVELNCLGKSAIEDIVFFSSRYLIMSLEDTSVYALKFLEKSLKLSTYTTEEFLLFAATPKKWLPGSGLYDHDSSQKVKLVSSRKQLLLLRCNEAVKDELQVIVFEVKNGGRPTIKKSMYVYIHKFDFYGSFLYRKLKHDQLGEIGDLFPYPFFEVEAGEKNINQGYGINQDDDGTELVLHKVLPLHQEYRRKQCCSSKDVEKSETKPISNIREYSPSFNYESMVLIGKFILYKQHRKPYLCAYDVQLGITYHKVLKLGYHIELMSGTSVGKDFFILVTHRRYSAYDTQDNQSDILPFIKDRSFQGLGSCQILLMKWERSDEVVRFVNILEQEYQGIDNFIKNFRSWVYHQKLTKEEDLQIKLGEEVAKSLDKVTKGAASNSSFFGTFSKKHFKAFNETSKRMSQKHNLLAKVVSYQVTQLPVYRCKYTGSHLVCLKPGGEIKCFPIS